MTQKSEEKAAGITIEDPHNVTETYVDTMISCEIRNDHLVLTMGVRRPLKLGESSSAGHKFVVVERIALAFEAAVSLRQALLNGIKAVPVAEGSSSKN
jgi:hypothetical protein